MNFPFSSISRLVATGVMLMMVSCAVDSRSVTSVPVRKAERVMYRWYDDGGSGSVAIRISLSDQIAEFTRGGRDIGWSYVATGKESHGTKPGSYKITEKIVDKYSNRYGWFEDEWGNVTNPDAKYNDRVPPGERYVPAPMPYWMRLTSYGIGMHGGMIPEPGKPASHGCIRLPKDFVPQLYSAVVVGTPVTITNAPSKQMKTQDYSPVSEREWTIHAGVRSAESVTYRNGSPVFYR
jgi:hypothetical protein